jgi:uncharacterized protein (DUF3820 family)
LGLTLAALQECLDLAGTRVIPQGRTRYSRLTFGMYRGKRLNEVPADYLAWLWRERPQLLTRSQVAEVDRLLRKLGWDRS